MADVVVGTGEVSSGRLSLVADEVQTITFSNNIGAVQVISDGAAAVYYTVDGTDPTVDGTNTFELPAGSVSVDERTTVNTVAGDVVKLISSGTPSIRVQSA